MPGGVNSPVRAFKAVGGDPLFIDRGEGAYLIDVDGNRLLDCVSSWGPLLFGHAHPRIKEAIVHQAEKGFTFGAPTSLEIELAEIIADMMPSMERIRLVSSGTEATMSAIRLARGFTDRPKILKFEGGYHGHSDCLLAKSGSGVATLGIPDSAGVPPSLTAETITAPYNDIDAVRTIFRQMGSEIACVIVEPVAGNMGCLPPLPTYLQSLRDITEHYGALLIFDEVMTGFRVAKGGAQELFGIHPDLTTLGKIIGGGLPLAAYGGRADIMRFIAPEGPVYQAGTLSGNPLAVTAGLETLRMIQEHPGIYNRLEECGQTVANEWRASATRASIPVTVNQQGSMMTIFFTGGPVCDYSDAKKSDLNRFQHFFRSMLEKGFYMPPSQFECMFLSSAMSAEDITGLSNAGSEALKEL
jgi:glutamate-1-semialdehyde 2,1-aminomutase